MGSTVAALSSVWEDHSDHQCRHHGPRGGKTKKDGRQGFGFLLLSIGTALVMNELWQLLCADHQDVSFVTVCVKRTSMILSGKLAM